MVPSPVGLSLTLSLCTVTDLGLTDAFLQNYGYETAPSAAVKVAKPIRLYTFALFIF